MIRLILLAVFLKHALQTMQGRCWMATERVHLVYFYTVFYRSEDWAQVGDIIHVHSVASWWLLSHKFLCFSSFWRWTNISCCLLVSLLFTAPGERWTKKSNRFVPFSFPLKGERWNECSRMRHPFFLVSHGISIASRIGSFSLLFNVRLPFELIKFYSLSCHALKKKVFLVLFYKMPVDSSQLY